MKLACQQYFLPRRRWRMLQVPQEHFRLSRLPWTRTERWRLCRLGGFPTRDFAGSTGAKNPWLSTKGASPKRCLEDGSLFGWGCYVSRNYSVKVVRKETNQLYGEAPGCGCAEVSPRNTVLFEVHIQHLAQIIFQIQIWMRYTLLHFPAYSVSSSNEFALIVLHSNFEMMISIQIVFTYHIPVLESRKKSQMCTLFWYFLFDIFILFIKSSCYLYTL